MNSAGDGFVAMKVVGLALDPQTQLPIVLLQDTAGTRTFPIWIGILEASAIAALLEKLPLSRPMTHELLRASVEALGGRVERVDITALHEGTFYAVVHLRRGEERFAVDARPSDAIALALQAGAPLFVAEEVLLRARQVEVVGDGVEPPAPVGPLTEEDRARFAELLEQMTPSQFGKYRM